MSEPPGAGPGGVERVKGGPVVADGLSRPRSSPWGSRGSTRTAGAPLTVLAAALDVDPHTA
jgi:hypothetical protein